MDEQTFDLQLELDPADGQVAVVTVDATAARYQAGLRTFAGIDQILLGDKNLEKVLTDQFTSGDVVVRGLHRFVENDNQLQQIIASITTTGLDRTAGISSMSGEGVHVWASFMNDRWSSVLAYTTESPSERLPSENVQSIGIILIYDNSDGGIVYVDPASRRICF